MPTRSIRRNASIQGYAKADQAPIYVDADDNIMKFIPAGSGTTEVEVVDSTSTQTISGDKTFTGTVVMSGAVTKTEFADGAVGAPSMTFSSDLTTGFYRIGASNVALALGGTKVFDFLTTGLVMLKTAVKGIRIGDWVGSGAVGSAVPFSTTQNIYSDGQLDILGVYGESSSDLTSAYSAKCARFRHLVHTDASAGQETYGAAGQCVVRDTTLTHLHAGLLGTFEGNGAGAVLNSSYTTGGHAAIMARIGGHAVITATTPLSGFLAFNNASAALASGSSYAFSTSVASTSYPWSVGLFIPADTCTTAIDARGLVSMALTLTSATPATTRLVWSELTVTPATSVAVGSNGSLAGVRGCVTLTTGKSITDGYIYGVQGKAVLDGATVEVGSDHVAGVYAQLSASGATITSGHVAILAVSGQSLPASANVNAIYVESGGATINSMLQSNCRATYIFDLNNFESAGCVSSSGTPGSVTGATGWIKCLVDGAVRYIPLASSVS